MTYAEKYKEQIWEFICKYGETPAIDKQGQFVECSSIQCRECLFSRIEPELTCSDRFKEWLQAEYKEPEIDWSEVEIDTPILVSNDGKTWYNRHFARYCDGKVYSWNNGLTSWSNRDKDGEVNVYRLGCWKYIKLKEGDH